MKRGIWNKEAKIKKIYPYLSNDMSADVIIIGGGINGAICSYFLAKEGFKIVVLEKDLIGFNDTSVSFSVVTDFIEQMYEKNNMKDQDKIEMLERLRKDAGMLLKEILVDIGMISNTKFIDYNIVNKNFFSTRKMKEEEKCRKELGEEVEFSKKNGKLYVKKYALEIDPYEFVQKVFEYLSTFTNVYIYENTPVIKIAKENNIIHAFTKYGYKVVASSVIVTTSINNLNFYTIPIVNVKRRFIAEVDVKNILEPQIIKIQDEDNLYIKIDDSKKIIISGLEQKYNVKMDDEKYIENIERENAKRFKKILKNIFRNVEFASEIICRSENMIETKDKLPIITELKDFPNVYIIAGSGAMFLSHYLIGAKLITDSIKGFSKKEMNMFKLNR